MQRGGEIVVEVWPSAAGKTDEARLVQSILDGDRAAFDGLVRSHSPQVTSIARRFLRDPNDLDDVVQETFLRAFQNLRRFRGQSTLRTWLIQIALNVCRDRSRAFWKRRVALTADAGASDSAARSNSFSDASVLLQTVEAAVAALPEKLRIPFTLHAFDELSGVEIAAVLGCNESTVWTRIYTARKKLQASLGDSLDY
ncbi:MAG: RNA polymerase sigma factor [Actinomycetota bacterium]